MIRAWTHDDETLFLKLNQEILAADGITAAFNWPVDAAAEEFASTQGLVDLEPPKASSQELVPTVARAGLLYRALPDSLEVSWVGVHPRFRRLGLAEALLHQLFSIAQAQSKEVWLEVHFLNEKARALYEKLGFLEVGRRPRYYSDGSAALSLIWKPN